MTSLTILAARAARQREHWSTPARTVTAREAAKRPVVRMRTRLPWLDLMLGGGFVRGAVVMVHGAPGAGKSTMLAQAAAAIRGAVYNSAEEGIEQVAHRVARLGLRSDLELLTETDIHVTLEAAGRAPLIVVDSLQMMQPDAITAAKAMVAHARNHNVAVVMVVHELKGGRFAGPQIVEHLIDCTIALDRGPPRIITTEKNRFGEAGISLPLQMNDKGLSL